MGSTQGPGTRSSASQKRGRAQSLAKFDVIVAGGGPAGAASAIALAQADLSVVLVDRHAFPRDKVCGDFVSPLAVKQLQTLGITHTRPFSRSNVIRDAAVFLDGDHRLTGRVPTSSVLPASRVIPRKTLDNLLIERARSAGVEIRERCRVTSFGARPRKIRVSVRDGVSEREIDAQVLIGADGSNSLVARLMRGHAPADDDRIVAVRGYYESVHGPAERADLYFSSGSFPGYCWLFPTLADAANVGLGMLRTTLPPTRDHLRSQLQRLIETDTALAKRLSGARPVTDIVGWALTTYNGDEAIVDDRTVLVGDAAGLINPLNGEGIQYALLSGLWAAETVRRCIARGDCSKSALQPYAARIGQELGRDFLISRALVQLIRNRSLSPLWLEALRTIVGRAAVDAEYARLTGGVLAGVVPARQVINLEVVRKTLEQAALRAGARAGRAPVSVGGLLESSINASQLAIDVASTMLRDETASERWALDLATTVRNLLTQSVRYQQEEDYRGEDGGHVVGRQTADAGQDL
jgi:geranylgeranyl reductase family protein